MQASSVIDSWLEVKLELDKHASLLSPKAKHKSEIILKFNVQHKVVLQIQPFLVSE